MNWVKVDWLENMQVIAFSCSNITYPVADSGGVSGEGGYWDLCWLWLVELPMPDRSEEMGQTKSDPLSLFFLFSLFCSYLSFLCASWSPLIHNSLTITYRCLAQLDPVDCRWGIKHNQKLQFIFHYLTNRSVRISSHSKYLWLNWDIFVTKKEILYYLWSMTLKKIQMYFENLINFS